MLPLPFQSIGRAVTVTCTVGALFGSGFGANPVKLASTVPDAPTTMSKVRVNVCVPPLWSSAVTVIVAVPVLLLVR